MDELVLNELAFDDSEHKYYLNGTELPSVTTIMQPLSQAEYGTVDKQRLAAAASRGTSVHDAIENYIKYGIDDARPEYRGFMDAFLSWWNQYNPEPIGSEVRMYHKTLLYAGTGDLIAKINGELVLIDFKTTAKIIDKACRVQLEAYAQALKTHGIEIKRKYILRISNDGTFEFREYKAKDAEALRIWTALKTVYDYILA